MGVDNGLQNILLLLNLIKNPFSDTRYAIVHFEKNIIQISDRYNL